MNELHSNVEYNEIQESNYSSGMDDKLFTRLIDLSYFKELQDLKTKAQNQTNSK